MTVCDLSATAVPPTDFDRTVKSNYVDLVSSAMGGRVVAYSDQFFADAANLLTPGPPVRQPGKMVYTGAWYDGWETRRHNPAPFDWVVVRLGVASGMIAAVEVDTAFFSGNHAPAVSVQACAVFEADADALVTDWATGSDRWEPVLRRQECGPSRRHCWRLGPLATRPYTHVRLCMYPDGGIARFRLFGHAVPVFPANLAAELDLAAACNGGVAVACSDQHFGAKENLLLPGHGQDMSDGWETARSRVPNHTDWAIIRLGAPAWVRILVVDTAHFRGNFPQFVRIEAIDWPEGHGVSEDEPAPDPDVQDPAWITIVPDSPCGPDQEHRFDSAAPTRRVTHVKLVIIPDGGVKRLRVLGSRAH